MRVHRGDQRIALKGVGFNVGQPGGQGEVSGAEGRRQQDKGDRVVMIPGPGEGESKAPDSCALGQAGQGVRSVGG